MWPQIAIGNQVSNLNKKVRRWGCDQLFCPFICQPLLMTADSFRLVMATRSGDIDPGMLPFTAKVKQRDVHGLDTLLNKESGLLGVCGHSDMRDIAQEAEQGNTRCQLAQDIFVHRVRKYIGAYLLNLNFIVHAIVFSGGIGEHSPLVREQACAGLQALGTKIDAESNAAADGKSIRSVSTGGGPDVLVVPTDEELCIAKDAAELAQAH